jgi:putative endonuclease
MNNLFVFVVMPDLIRHPEMNKKNYYVYILANKRNGTLYIGITSSLKKRIYQHKNNAVDSFTKKYQVHKLVYYEQTSDAYVAISREKNLKNWKRKWKLLLIEKNNPEWKDLYYKL